MKQIAAIAALVHSLGIALALQAPAPARDELLAAFKQGDALWRDGRVQQAVPYFEKIVKLAPQVFGAFHLDTADMNNRLGLLYYETKQFALSESQFVHAVRIREDKLGRDDPLVGQSLNNLAIQLKEQGRYDKAEAPLRRALEIQQKANPREPGVADIMDNLAFLLEILNRHDEAMKLFTDSLTIRKAKRGDDHPETAQSLRNLAGQFLRSGKLEEAQLYFEKSLHIFENALGGKHRKVAISLHSLALLQMTRGQPKEALPLLERCLEIQRGNGRSEDPEVSVGLVLENLAVVHGCLGHWTEAAAAMDEAQRIYLRFVATVLPCQPENEQLTFLRTSFEPTMHRALSLAVAAKGTPQMRTLSASWLLNGRGMVHRALAERSILARDGKDADAAKLVEQLQAARDERASLSFLMRGKPSTELAEKLSNLARKDEELVKALAEQRGRPAPVGEVSLEQVRQVLPADAILIEIVRYNRTAIKAGPELPTVESYAAWIITPAGKGSVEVVDLGPAAPIDEAAATWRRALQQGPNRIAKLGEAKAVKEMQVPAEALSKLLVHPLLAYASKARQWLLSPDGDLWLVPWAALRLPGGNYVVESHEVRYVISGRDLAAKPKAAAANAPLVLADPDYDFDLGDKPGTGNAAVVAQWGRLPGTAAEAKAIAPALEKWLGKAPRVLTGSQARENAFKWSPSPLVLVLSTHGFFLEDQAGSAIVGSRGLDLDVNDSAVPKPRVRVQGLENPLLRCGLILAGANRRATNSSGEDGVLTGLEIVGADLRGTQLVVLSACETGVGQVHYGEGVAGLRQAFQLAGARVVAATLWKVADQETMQFVAGFFDQLAKGDSPAAALRSSQLQMIAQRQQLHGAAHPYYWASFTLTGV